MKSFSTLCIAALVMLLCSCQKEIISPRQNDQSISAKLFCGNLSIGDVACEQKGLSKGKITLGNCKNAIYLEVTSPEKYTKARVYIKKAYDGDQNPTMYMFNFIHADALDNNLYAFKNVYKPGESILVMVELSGTSGSHEYHTAPFVTHLIQGCN
jgi:hypothetical protein